MPRAAREPQRRWHSLDVEASLRELATDAAQGLDNGAAAERLLHFGPNELGAEERRGLLRIVLAQFTDFMILVLLSAAVISGLLGDMRDAVAIIVIVALNAAIGATQDFRAQRAIAALKKMTALEARVVREGTPVSIPVAELVPGDLVKLGAGDVVPADLRLVDTQELEANEAALTGESVPVAKSSDALADEELAVGDRRNMAFKQTSVTKGSGLGVVVGTGLRTEIGRIASLLAERDHARTPLQQRLAAFGTRLALIVLVICAVIFGLGVAGGQPPLLMFLTAVSLAVAAIPEALPAVVTVALAIGAKKLSRQQSLVRRLPAVESLGSVTYICADKTGTLTENRMTLAAIALARNVHDDAGALPEPVRAPIGEVLALCNEIDPKDPDSSDPTERALYDAAHAAGFEKSALLERLPQIGLLAFDSERKLMTTLHRHGSGTVVLSKGAPESVLARCGAALGDDGETVDLDAAPVQAQIEELSGRGYRLLALASRDLPSATDKTDADAVEAELTFLALVALADPPRPEAAPAIAKCLRAGITPIMITGDHPQTAGNIGLELGITDDPTAVLTGGAVEELGDRELLEQLRRVRIFARVNPEQKIRIVEVLQNAGEFVAMTGDGVNDAPALKQASIGIAMGRRGTDVAREASDMVLLDDNFATIVAAVSEGRRIYDNIRKFIKYTMTSNAGEIWVLLLAPLIGLPLPLLPIHILWINLVTDGLPGLAFSAEPAERDVMRRAPRPPNESVFAGGMWQHMLWVGLLIGGLSLLTAAFTDTAALSRWQTMVFTTLVTAQLFQSLAVRSDTDSIFSIGFFSNRYLLFAILGTLAAQAAVVYVPLFNPLLQTVPLPLGDFTLCVALGAVVLVAIEMEKWARRRKRRPHSGGSAG